MTLLIDCSIYLIISDETLSSLIERGAQGSVKPETEEEKACFRLLSDLDHVNYKVKGLITSKNT